jgi:hypothetical protein
MKEFDLLIDDGIVRHVYNDDLAGLFDDYVRDEETTRASHVEPDGLGGWTADMTPVAKKKVVLGPFRLRSEALDAEVAWLREHMQL